MRSRCTGSPLALVSILLLVAALGCGDDPPTNIDATVMLTDAEPPDAPPPDARPDATPPPDARPPALDCLGEPLPTTADDPVDVSGQVFTLTQSGQSPVEDALVEGFVVGNDTPVDSANSDAQGSFAITADTGGTPIDAYLKATHASYLDTYLYPATPVYEDVTDTQVLMLSQQIIDALSLAGIEQDDDKGIVLVVAIDCEGFPINGASITSSPAAGQTVYLDNMMPSLSATETDSTGTAMLFDVPTGDVEIDAEVMGMSLREHTVQVRAVAPAAPGDAAPPDGAITTTIVVP